MAAQGPSPRRHGALTPALLLGAAAFLAARWLATSPALGWVAPRTSGSSGVDRALAAGVAPASAAAGGGRREATLGGAAALLAAAAPAVAEERKDLYATFKVDLGGAEAGKEKELKVKLRPDWAPRGVRRFKELVRIGELQDSAVFHVDEGNGLAHFGLPAEPTLTPAPIQDDDWRFDAQNMRGTISFAAAGDHTRTNQLFFNTADNRHLDRRGFTPIGEVVGDGMDVVDKFYSGYGSKVDRHQVVEQGNEYLDAHFPKLSKIKSVELFY